jgi:hypothetical protein
VARAKFGFNFSLPLFFSHLNGGRLWLSQHHIL